MDNFYKYVKERGLINDLHQAFIDNPVEKEVHKGDPDYFIKEKRTIYSKYSVGDIVFVKDYVYLDGKKGKNHLFVIIAENNIAVEMEHIGMILSSQIQKVKYAQNILIKKNDNNGLNKDSIIKTDNVYQIFDSNIEFKIGMISKEQLDLYINTYMENVK